MQIYLTHSFCFRCCFMQFLCLSKYTCLLRGRICCIFYYSYLFLKIFFLKKILSSSSWASVCVDDGSQARLGRQTGGNNTCYHANDQHTYVQEDLSLEKSGIEYQ